MNDQMNAIAGRVLLFRRMDSGKPPSNAKGSSISHQTRWDAMWTQLAAYKSAHGHCMVRRGPGLGRWVANQHQARRQGLMDPKRIARLETLGFKWSTTRGSNRARGSEMLESLKSYKAQHGDCNVPVNFAGDVFLGRWVASQRVSFNAGKLSRERIERLNAIGFEWSIRDATPWEEHYAALKDFMRIHGHCRLRLVPGTRWELIAWAATQRLAHRKGYMSPERTALMVAIGFSWNLNDDLWNRNIERLKKFIQAHGHGDVGQKGPEISLYTWAQSQRDLRLRGRLSSERIERLNAINFEWRTIRDRQKAG